MRRAGQLPGLASALPGRRCLLGSSSEGGSPRPDGRGAAWPTCPALPADFTTAVSWTASRI
jgi:hypothetical protein